jgi:4-hydroxybenzoate polyprenyltransferase
VLGATALGGAFALGRSFGLVASGYVLLLVLYSFTMKHVVILDVLTIALGFVLRAIAGAFAVGVPFSNWLLLCTLLGALFLGAYVDRHGRRAGLVLTLTLMAVGTLSIACVPGYATIGLAAPAIVLIGRLLQGISAGAQVASLFDHVDLDGNLLLARDPWPGVPFVDGVQLPPEEPGLGVHAVSAAR